LYCRVRSLLLDSDLRICNTFKLPPYTMKQYLLVALSLCLFAACQQDNTRNSAQNASNEAPLTLNTTANPEWQYEQLRLYPVTAANLAQATGGHLKTLSEAMKTDGFRVLERKQFGRGNETWYHGVTIQNKTQDTVLIMSGDVVTGGNQDRIMAYHDVILPGTVKNVEVFCVEAGRSHYYDTNASPAEKSVGAFKGYYNVASPHVRHAVQSSGNQNEVWAAVAKITRENGAESSTQTYAALDNASDQKQTRDSYLKFFDGKFANDPAIVGVVAVSGDRVLGIDIFGSSDLFQRQFSAILHGYVAEAAIAPKSGMLSDAVVTEAFHTVARLSAPEAKPTTQAGKYGIGDQWVHLFKK
jgi:hypothetical protein